MTLARTLALISTIADIEAVDFDYVGGDFFLEISTYTSNEELAAIQEVVEKFKTETTYKLNVPSNFGQPYDYVFKYDDGTVYVSFLYPEDDYDYDEE